MDEVKGLYTYIYKYIYIYMHTFGQLVLEFLRGPRAASAQSSRPVFEGSFEGGKKEP